MRNRRVELNAAIRVLPLMLALATLWLIMQGYQGLTGDAQLYAFQAFSKLHPALATDLYLQNTSQDQYTIFSPFYAFVMGRLGLETSARVLTLCFSAWMVIAAWALASAIARQRANAWLSAAFLMIVPADYGASHVFRYFDLYLTARLPAEALVVTALACRLNGMKWSAFVIAVGAMTIHPLIALPCCLVLVSLELSWKANLIIASVGIATLAGAAAAAAKWDIPLRILNVMDPHWLAVVQERSQFLFLQFWTHRDWELNLRPIAELTFCTIVLPEKPVRKLCLATMLVAATGLVIALIGSLEPVALIIQGQAWRWVWLAALLAALLIPLACITAWQRDKTLGPLCVLLLIAGSVIWPNALIVLCAVIIWCGRRSFPTEIARFLRIASALMILATLCWVSVKAYLVLREAAATMRADPQMAIRHIFRLGLPAVLAASVLWFAIYRARTVWMLGTISALLVALGVAFWPSAFKQRHPLDSIDELKEFSTWRGSIPPSSTVLVSPTRDVGQFVWFTLERPNYLSINQSAGVVFSRETALEIERRSKVLEPLMQPNWKIRTNLHAYGSNGVNSKGLYSRLTPERLREVCSDPALGFLIAPEDLGFGGVTDISNGIWHGWNLYDCRRLRGPKTDSARGAM